MPAKIIGMIGATPVANNTVHVIEGGVSPAYLEQSARLHEEAGYDAALIGYFSSSAEGFALAQHAASKTNSLEFIIAHRPGISSPALIARKIATVDHLTQGRIAMHIIAGVSDDEQAREGDFLDKSARYDRSAEYLDSIKAIWSSNEPIDYSGKYIKLRGAVSDVKPWQSPGPTLYFGGTSENAVEMGAKFCDVYMIFGEPLEAAKQRIENYQHQVAQYNRTARVNMSFRPIIADTEKEAWEKAERIRADIEAAQNSVQAPMDSSASRSMKLAMKQEVYDERFWLGVAKSTGANGNTAALVGTPEQVAESLLDYYKLGVESFLLRGFDPQEDTKEFGRELIPRLKEGALEYDKQHVVSQCQSITVE